MISKWQVVELLNRGVGRKSILSFADTMGKGEWLFKEGETDKLCEQYEKLVINIVCYWEDKFPEPLKNIPDPPVALFYRGVLPGAGERLVAVVGSRDLSERGRVAAKAIVRELVKDKLGVVSGLAIGTDTEVHQQCLKSGGRTVAVLPCGLETVYPWRNRRLAGDIVESGGCLVSEYPMGTVINKRNFLERNRIVSGLSRAIVVTEAGLRSGSISTPNFAVDQGRDVWCVRARVGEKNSEGILQLIEDGASVVEAGEDIGGCVGP